MSHLLAHFDWYVLLTPVFLLPIFLLFVFVGCQQILGIEEGVPATPEVTEAPELVFEYTGGLRTDLERIAWVFEDVLEHPAGESTPTSFPTEPFFRGNGVPKGIDPNGEVVNHGTVLGEPTGGRVVCRVFGFLAGDAPNEPTLQDEAESFVADADFGSFRLEPPFQLS